MVVECFLLFVTIAFLSSAEVKNSTLFTIKEIYSTRFPEGYVAPSRLIRKVFKLKDKLIPKYLNFELYVSLLFAILGAVNTIICAISGVNPTVVHVLVMFHICLIILNAFFFAIATFVFRRRR